MLSPLRPLLVLLLTLALCLGLVLLFPEGIIPLGGNADLKFVSLNSLSPAVHDKAQDSSRAVRVEEIKAFAETMQEDSAREEREVAAELEKVSAGEVLKPRQLDAALLSELDSFPFRLQFPDGEDKLMTPFYESLDALAQRPGLIRVLHYGDSQVEGDRVSGTLRTKLQRQFGGFGAGMVPVFEPGNSRASIKIESSDNWTKKAIYGNLFHNVPGKRFGILGANYHSKNKKAVNVTLKRSPTASANTRKYNVLKMYYGENTAPIKVTVTIGKDSVLHLQALPGRSPLLIDMKQATDAAVSLDIQRDDETTEIYAVALDSYSGVMVDNISMRGSSGREFAFCDVDYMAAQARAADTRLIILQFGTNMAVDVRENYNFYEKWLYTQIMRFRAALPNVPIVLVGVADAARKEGPQYESYPNIPKIRDAQRRAALRAGAAFWDLYEMMGGQGSMIEYVKAAPSLAEKDYTHFNHRGAMLVGNMLYKAILQDYSKYKKTKGL